MMQRPPRSTLFPYTPLSRSILDYGHTVDFIRRALRRIVPQRPDLARNEQAAPARLLVLVRAGRLPPRRGDGHPAERDRKSTRLNSSHANISYAVFCLKKQKL